MLAPYASGGHCEPRRILAVCIGFHQRRLVAAQMVGRMIPAWGYTVLRSEDKKTMVQIFTDLETGSILYAQVCTRPKPWGVWEPPTEVAKVD